MNNKTTYRDAREALIKSFDRLRTNDKLLIPFVASLSNHEWNQLVQRFPKHTDYEIPAQPDDYDAVETLL
jgi:hypothetical protein